MAPPPPEPEQENPNRRFLQCPGSLTVHHLKKFIMRKYGLVESSFLVDVIYKDDLLPEDLTLVDVAYSYDWRKVRE
jgi:polycomb group RING finger protein 4